jgi:hypothetical protein
MMGEKSPERLAVILRRQHEQYVAARSRIAAGIVLIGDIRCLYPSRADRSLRAAIIERRYRGATHAERH